MFPARALRRTTSTPCAYTRHTSSPFSSSQRILRPNSSLAGGTIREESTEESDSKASRDQEAAKPILASDPLSAKVGSNYVAKGRALEWEMRRLTAEIKRTQQRRRFVETTLKGPYTVRTRGYGKIPEHIADSKIEVKDNQVTYTDRKIPNIWLRDNCQCSSCIHDATKQRLLDTFSIPKDIAIESHSFEGEGPSNEVLNIKWSDGHSSAYPASLIKRTTRSEEIKGDLRRGKTHINLWDSSIASSPPSCYYQEILGQSQLHLLLGKLHKYGFCYVDHIRFHDPAETKALLESIAFIRQTHYGGFYDFTADLASKDTAYTNIALEAHTDTTYFSDPAGLQAFHLLSHTDGEGGASLLVDGFKVADELLQTDKNAYKVLSTVNVHAHASGNEGISIQPYRGFPVLEHDVATGELLRVRWNSSDRASIELPIDEVETWYDAARKFDALLKKKENEYWEQLVPGRVLIFDNWRVLHGRSAFTGKRRICGGYVNRDDWISKYRMLLLGREKVLEELPVS
ncbi:Trimethyllysine dioxygenase [Decorospora gaudefroyi]|uniref:Trimethyllysine dioxygenase n=1 Tax=Decorospora gaudefroyi TaxID=184978 RepID=A0A6A5KLM1_9PLEO|nr:Trimethyllysine dioxygenase [Decorospora gaudefroyi]